MPPSLFHAASTVAICAVPLLAGLATGCYDPVVSVNPGAPIPLEGGPNQPPGPNGGPGNGNENTHHNSQFIIEDGESITLSGTITCEEAVTGHVQLDFLKLDESGQRAVVHGLQVAGLGDWQELAPKGFGEVYIMAFADNDRNGPSETDPKAVAGPIDIGSAAIDSIRLDLQQNADMGRLALSTTGERPSGSAPPGGSPDAANAAPSDGPPPPDEAEKPEPQPSPTDAAAAAGSPGEAPASVPKPGPNGEVGTVRTGATAEDPPK
ncbi:MAG: hypothetical protein CL927_00715 [Deltaproteobacteria bacterium]|nr:hypothetical protein [Deltaproteobacteria bacterium]